MAVLPALPWFGADLPTGRADLTGYGAGGVAWILPVIGAVLATAGILVAWWTPQAGTRPARLLGGAVVLMAALGVAWSAIITYRGATIRIISIRRARQEEVARYGDI